MGVKYHGRWWNQNFRDKMLQGKFKVYEMKIQLYIMYTSHYMYYWTN